jgi:hypothetical protein
VDCDFDCANIEENSFRKKFRMLKMTYFLLVKLEFQIVGPFYPGKRALKY